VLNVRQARTYPLLRVLHGVSTLKETAVVRRIHGATSSESPFPPLQQAAVSITRLAVPWWANRMANSGHLAFAKDRNTVMLHPGSENTASIPSAVQKKLDAPQSRLLDAGINEPTDWKSDSETKGGMTGTLVTGNSLSVNAENISLLSLLENLSRKCDIEILGKDALCDKVISAEFDSMKVEHGIRQIMRIAGVDNYALTYRTDPEDQYSVSQIVLLPVDHKVPEDHPIAKAGPQVDLTDHPQAQSLGNVAAEIPEEILADLKAEIQAEVPADMQADTLAEILREFRQ
jgi:hypothetical protein